MIDHRYKIEFIFFTLSTVYEKEKGVRYAKKVKLAIYELFDDYKIIYQTSNVNENLGNPSETIEDQFVQHKMILKKLNASFT